MPGPSRLDIRQHGADDENDRQFTQALQLLVETEDRTRHVGRGGIRIRRLFFGAGPGMLDIRGWRDLTVLTLDTSHRQPCGEHREKAIGVNEQRDAIRKRDEPESEELVESNRLAVDAPQIEDELPDTGPAEGPDAEARGYSPHEVHGRASASRMRQSRECPSVRDPA